VRLTYQLAIGESIVIAMEEPQACFQNSGSLTNCGDLMHSMDDHFCDAPKAVDEPFSTIDFPKDLRIICQRKNQSPTSNKERKREKQDLAH
jgi:hypothetical protein